MAANVYLGYPPPNVRKWIEEEYKKKKTIITFDDESTKEYELIGEVSQQKLNEAGIYDIENGAWLKNPVSVQFGTTVTTVGDNAFDNCFSLTSISMPNVTTVGNYVFTSCANLASVSMPSVTTICGGAFNSCESLASVSMPSVTTIGVGAFGSCTSLVSVSMPNATTICEYAFNSCESLASVSIPNVTTIGADAFGSCNLASVSIPNVTTIGETAFAHCPHLSTVSMPSTASVSDYAFYDISRSLSFINQSTEKISEWFGNWVFGEYLEPITVSCSNGSVYAEWNDNERKWNVTENPA